MTTATDWSGRVGDVWAEEWRRTERAFAPLAPLLEEAILALAPDCGSFLDIGCGVGSTALAIARARPAAQVTGVDLSAGMIAIATERAAETPNAGFVHADVLEHDAAHAPYDLLFSRHGVMFFADAAIAFRRLHDAASPDAPLVFSCFGPPADNPWATLLGSAPARSASYVPGPFAFADEAIGRDILLQAGWRDPRARQVAFNYRAGQGDDPVAEALALFTRIGPAASALRDADPSDRHTLLSRLADRVALYRNGDTVDFPASAWLWSARA